MRKTLMSIMFLVVAGVLSARAQPEVPIPPEVISLPPENLSVNFGATAWTVEASAIAKGYGGERYAVEIVCYAGKDGVDLWEWHCVTGPNSGSFWPFPDCYDGSTVTSGVFTGGDTYDGTFYKTASKYGGFDVEAQLWRYPAQGKAGVVHTSRLKVSLPK